MKGKTLIFYIVILAVAVLIRLCFIQSIPPGVNRDEASIGFTAYSLLMTQTDEYGRFLPLSFQSFGDWKLPLYIYLVVPMIWLFGLTEFAVRFPSALFGIATVAIVYFLVRDMFKNNALALIAMALLALSPWHIHLSRVESESNTAVFFITLGMLLFLEGIRRSQVVLIISALLFALTYFTYAGNHVFTTLLIIGLFLVYRKEVPKTKTTVVAIIVFLLFFGLIVSQTLLSASKTKLSGIGIFGDPSIIHTQIELPRTEHSDSNFIFSRIIHNKVVFAGERFMQNYLNAFSPQFLFIKGGENKAHNIENFGNMYLVEAPFLLLGFFFLLFLKKSPEKKILLWWLLIAPLAASITKDAPHTNRMFAIQPALSIVVAIGIYYSYLKLKPHLSRVLLTAGVGVFCFFFLINVLTYVDRYFIHFPRNEGESWGNGWKMLSRVLNEKQFKKMDVIIGRPEYSPYIFLSFYQKTDPSYFQKSVVRYPPTDDAFVHVKKVGRYNFREIDWGADLKGKNKLIISFPKDAPEEIVRSHKHVSIVLPDGNPMFYIFESQ